MTIFIRVYLDYHHQEQPHGHPLYTPHIDVITVDDGDERYDVLFIGDGVVFAHFNELQPIVSIT